MADKNITIGINTTGANAAAAEVGKLATAVGAVSVKQAGFEKSANAVTKSSASMRMGIQNAAFQIQDMAVQLEMGTNAMRVMSQQVPQLLGGFGPAGAVAGAVIGIGAALAGPLVTSMFQAKKSVKELSTALEEERESLEKIYSQIEEESRKFGEKAIQDAEVRRKKALDSAGINQTITGNRAGLAAAQEVGGLSVMLAGERNRLAEVERSITLASGQDAVRLAKEREATVQRILKAEQAIAEAGRQRELAIARGKVDTAQTNVDATKGAAGTVEAQADQLNYRLAAVKAEINERAEVRLIRQEQFAIEIAEAQARLKLLVDKFDPKTGPEAQRGLAEIGDAASLVDKLKARGAPGQAIERRDTELAAKQKILEGEVAKIESDLKQSSSAQSEAAKAMTEAALAITNLKLKQEGERTQEKGLAAINQEKEIGGEVTNAAKGAISSIQGNAAQQGREVSPLEQDTIGRVQKLITDSSPDAQQGAELAGLLQMLANNLNAKDGELIKQIDVIVKATTEAAKAYKGLADRVKSMETAIKQIK